MSDEQPKRTRRLEPTYAEPPHQRGPTAQILGSRRGVVVNAVKLGLEYMEDCIRWCFDSKAIPCSIDRASETTSDSHALCLPPRRRAVASIHACASSQLEFNIPLVCVEVCTGQQPTSGVMSTVVVGDKTPTRQIVKTSYQTELVVV